MKLNFEIGTGSWIVGRALANLNPNALYIENGIGQVLELDKLKVDKDELNEAISKVKLVSGTKSTKLENVTVVELLEEAAGDGYRMDDEKWLEFKAWLKTKGELVSEAKDHIEIKEKHVSEVKSRGS